MIEVAKAARHLQSLFAEAEKAGGPRHMGGGVDYPGIGVIDANKPKGSRSQADEDVASELKILHSFVQGPITGAAVGGKEEQDRIAGLAGDATGWNTTEQSARTAIKALADIANSRIQQYGVGREDIAREALRSHGLDDLFPMPGPAAAATPQARPAAVDPLAGARELPVTRNVAPMPADALSGDEGGHKKYRLKAPKSGKTGTLDLTEDELQKYIAAGWQVL